MAGIGSFWVAGAGVEERFSWPSRTIAVGFVVASALVGSLAQPAQADIASTPRAAAALPAAEPASRPDAVSAGVSARVSGERVEVESLRDEFSRTFADPEGSFTTQSHAGQQRFLDDAGTWREVDLDLVAHSNGTVTPKGHAGGLVLAGGGGVAGSDLVSVKTPKPANRALANAGKKVKPNAAEPGTVALGWAKKLPKPVLEGTTATYPDVAAGVDLVVESRRTGFEQHFELKDRSAVPAGGAMSWDFTVKTKGLTARPDADGGVSFLNSKGEVASRIPPATAWDAVMDTRSGDPANTSPVGLTVTQQGKGLATLTVTPDAAWLADPARVFPVTVDPTYAAASIGAEFDTYVQSNIANTDQSASTELRVGTPDGGAIKARSFVHFNLGTIRGKQVTAAAISLHETYSYSCTAKPVEAWHTGGASTSSRWSAQPAWHTKRGELSVAKGYSSACGEGRISIPITSLGQLFADASVTSGAVGLRASETDSLGWKKFASSETAADPFLTWTYNRMPNRSTSPTVDQSGTYNSIIYGYKVRPTFRSTATDPDGSPVSYQIQIHSSLAADASSLVGACTTTTVASGGAGACTSPVDLANNSRYQLRAKAVDNLGYSGAWSVMREFRTAQTRPATPTINCPSHPNGSWEDDVPGAPVSCTVDTIVGGYSAPVSLVVSVDGVKTTYPIAQTPTTKTITVPNSKGGHTITAQTQSAATVLSHVATYSFGYGGAGLKSPGTGDATNGKFKVVAEGPARGSAPAVSATLQWRRAGAGTETEGWNTAALATSPTVVSTGPDKMVTTTFVWDSNTATSDTTTTPATAVSTRLPARLDVQVCFAYTGVATPQCTWSQTPSTVMRMPHAFGNGFPVAGAGPGQVALWTGEFNTSETDVTVPGYTGTLSLSRSHSTYDGPENLTEWPALPGSGVLGPGWTAQLDGSDVGDADLQVIDNSAGDGSIAFIDSEGTASVFVPANGRRRSDEKLALGEWVPADEDTEASGLVLSVKDTAHIPAGGGVAVPTAGGTADLILRSEDGTVTTFVAQTAPTAGEPGTFTPALVDEPGQLGATTYSRDSAGRTTRILAPVPPGVTCDGATLAPGCRALELTYAPLDTPSSTTVPPDAPGQLKSVALHAWNPDRAGGAAMQSVDVATYAYDASKRLGQVTDSRSGLATSYTYDGTTPRLASITPAGLAPFTLTYANNPVSGMPKQLASVSRPQAVPLGQTSTGPAVKVASFVYGIDPTQTAAGLPDLSASGVADWQQQAQPTYGAAVFAADKPQASHNAADVAAEDWQYAALQYTDQNGYTTNGASFGAGKWQVTAQDYDKHGNVIRSLDAGAIAAHQAAAADRGESSTLTAAQISSDPFATLTQYNTEERLTAAVTLADGTVLPVDHVMHAAGTRAVHEWGPARWARVSGQEELQWVRPHTTSVLDQGAPNNNVHPDTHQRYNLVTTATVGVANAETANTNAGGQTSADLELLSHTINGYGALEVGPTDAGPTSGWVVGSPTRVTQVLNPGTGPDPAKDISRVTVYDAEGRVIQTRQPSESGASNATTLPAAGPGTRRTRYYTAAAQTAPSGDPDCGAKPQWAGLECTVGPAAQPTTGTTLPVTTTGGFTMMLASKTSTETSGTVTRTSTSTLDAADRPINVSVTVTGLTGTEPVPTTTTTYDAATGLATSVAANGQTISTGYDTWGRQVTYTPAVGESTTTTFDAAGRVHQVTDPSGPTTTTYGYGPDANNKAEHRGMATSIRTETAGTTITDVTGAYNAEGALTEQVLPGQIRELITLDEAGEVTGKTYRGADPDGGTTPVDWLAWSQDNDALGRVVREYTPNASVFDTSEDAAPYHRTYTYDGAARLTAVEDRTADAATAGLVTSAPGEAVTFGTCERRDYTFDANGNRTHLKAKLGTTSGACPTPASSTTPGRTWIFDTADRVQTGARATSAGASTGSYVYDQLGRTLTMPAVDTLGATSPTANVAMGYYADDKPWTITQNGTTQTHSYDAGGRRTNAVSTGTTSKTLTRTYTDTSDNPTLTSETIPAQGITPQKITSTRYISGLTGDLTATRTTTNDVSTTELMLTNPHGDITTTIDLPAAAAAPATGVTGWNDTDEYGNPKTPTTGNTPAGGTTPAAYGWLGAKERSADTPAGLTFMGARLYNPVTGLFTALDPVHGGNDTAYAYPNDPINDTDLDGKRRRSSRWTRFKVGTFSLYLRKTRLESRWIGKGAAWAARRDGAKCSWRQGLQVCRGARGWSYSRSGTTFGDTYVTGSRRPSRRMLRHERVHQRQWRLYGSTFPILYAMAGRNACRNRWERAAGLKNGGYDKC